VTWEDDAACRDKDPTGTIFFPASEKDKRASPRIWERARAFCEVCPVRAPCLEDDMVTVRATGEAWGMRGGLTSRERERLADLGPRRATATHCKWGHDMANAYIDKRGWRICDTCRREQSARSHARRMNKK
jgi:hypothetical protein